MRGPKETNAQKFKFKDNGLKFNIGCKDHFYQNLDLIEHKLCMNNQVRETYRTCSGGPLV
jgi:hypothetical protein